MRRVLVLWLAFAAEGNLCAAGQGVVGDNATLDALTAYFRMFARAGTRTGKAR